MRFRAFRAACLAAAGFVVTALTSGGASAHPHVWVTVETQLLTDAQKSITGFRHAWIFDEFYTSFALNGLDKNNDGKYDKEELKELAEVNITSLRDFGFFTFPRVGKGDELPRQEPKDYFLEYDGKVLTLHFTLPLEKPLPKANAKEFQFAVYDPTFYVAFAFAEKDPIRMSAGLGDCRGEVSKPEAQAPAKSLSESVQSENDQLINTGEMFAESVRLKCGAGS